MLWSKVFIIISHIFLPLSLEFTYRHREKLWIEFLVISGVLFWSVAYHACYEYDICFLPREEMHRVADHFFAQMSIPLALFYIFKIDTLHIKGIGYFFIGNLNLILLLVYGIVAKVKVILVVVSLLIVVPLFFYEYEFREIRFKRLKCIIFLFAMVLISFGVLFFIEDEIDGDSYLDTHSFWHSFIFIGAYILLRTRHVRETDWLTMKNVSRVIEKIYYTTWW